MQRSSASSGLKGHALYLDVDGTMLDIASTPDRVEVPCDAVPLLRQLSSALEGAVARVSGRPIRAIDALFEPLRFPTIGVHGGEVRTAEGQLVRDQRLAEVLARVGPLLHRGFAALRAVALEDKGSALALHYRSMPERGREVLRLAELVVAELEVAGDFAIRLGKCVVEICPRHLTEGTALLKMMERRPFRGRTPIDAGDDSTDEDAFDVVNRLGGISVRIGGDGAPSAAKFRLTDPAQLRRWLLDIAAA